MNLTNIHLIKSRSNWALPSFKYQREIHLYLTYKKLKIQITYKQDITKTISLIYLIPGQ